MHWPRVYVFQVHFHWCKARSHEVASVKTVRHAWHQLYCLMQTACSLSAACRSYTSVLSSPALALTSGPTPSSLHINVHVQKSNSLFCQYRTGIILVWYDIALLQCENSEIITGGQDQKRRREAEGVEGVEKGFLSPSNYGVWGSVVSWPMGFWANSGLQHHFSNFTNGKHIWWQQIQ